MEKVKFLKPPTVNTRQSPYRLKDALLPPEATILVSRSTCPIQLEIHLMQLTTTATRPVVQDDACGAPFPKSLIPITTYLMFLQNTDAPFLPTLWQVQWECWDRLFEPPLTLAQHWAIPYAHNNPANRGNLNPPLLNAYKHPT